jgi:hypothetical protein
MSDDPQGSPPVEQTETGATEVPPESGRDFSDGAAPLDGEVMPPRKKMGRPTLYSDDLADDICDRLVNGGTTLRRICAEEGMPTVSVVYNWRHTHPDFGEKFQEARRRQADMLRDEADEIRLRLLEGTIEPSAAVVALRNIEWNLARLRPDIFGEHVGLGIGAPGQQLALTDKDQEAPAPAERSVGRPTDRQVIAWRAHGNGQRT